MDQNNQGNDHRALEICPKRKPGRPRKHPRPNADPEQNAIPRVQGLQRQENAPVVPGFAGINANQPRQINANDIAVGQVVHGVIDAVFNGGCLLTIRVGNSDNIWRGVIYRSSQDVPVAANNDSMIRPANPSNQLVVYNPRSRERNEQHVNSKRNRTAKLQVSGARHVPPVPILPRINVFPAAPRQVSIGKHTNQVLPLPPFCNPGMSKSVSAQVLHPAASGTLMLPCPPSENLPTEDPSQSDTTQMTKTNIENKDIDQPPSAEPRHTMLPDLNIPASPPEYFEDF